MEKVLQPVLPLCCLQVVSSVPQSLYDTEEPRIQDETRSVCQLWLAVFA